MRVAVAGGTGVVGSRVVEALRADGHDAVALSRRTGVDLTTGEGLDAAVEGVDAVVDTSNVSTLSADAAIRFFQTATGNLVAAAARAGVPHLVLLSIDASIMRTRGRLIQGRDGAFLRLMGVG